MRSETNAFLLSSTVPSNLAYPAFSNDSDLDISEDNDEISDGMSDLRSDRLIDSRPLKVGAREQSLAYMSRERGYEGH